VIIPVNKTVVRANIEFSTKHDKWNARIQRWYNTGACQMSIQA